MSRPLVSAPGFERAYRKFTRRDAQLQKKVDRALQRLEQDAHSPLLKTHKLSGKLQGLLACSCGYDCRIVFSIEENDEGEEVVLLIDIGTHDDVY